MTHLMNDRWRPLSLVSRGQCPSSFFSTIRKMFLKEMIAGDTSDEDELG